MGSRIPTMSMIRIKKYTERLRALQYEFIRRGEKVTFNLLTGIRCCGQGWDHCSCSGCYGSQGTRVCGFKVPSIEEASHDFLWRIEKQVPAKGEVVIFNRSHYEDVLVVRVHKTVPEEVWSNRYSLINHFEKGLAANGTHILKFYLHISSEEQLARFQERLDDPARQWKISEADYEGKKVLEGIHPGL
jgi:polyphosphate kinase 2 (PPK2 family)